MSNALLSNSKVLMSNSRVLVNFKNLANATSLKAWYAARLAPVIADNTAVSAWTDFSNNSTVLSQATGSKQPKYRTNIINGLPAYEFATDDNLAFTSTSLTQNKAGLTTYVVFKRSSGTGSSQTLFQFNNNANVARHSVAINTGAGFDQMFGAARRTTESAATASFAKQDTLFHVIANVTNYASDLISVWFDGELKQSAVIGGTAGANSQNAAASTPDIVGANTAAAGFLNGYIAEFIFCDAAHTGREVVDIMTALKRIYGGLPQ